MTKMQDYTPRYEEEDEAKLDELMKEEETKLLKKFTAAGQLMAAGFLSQATAHTEDLQKRQEAAAKAQTKRVSLADLLMAKSGEPTVAEQRQLHELANKNGDIYPKATVIVQPEAKHIDLLRRAVKWIMDQPGDKDADGVQLIVDMVTMIKTHEKNLTTTIEKELAMGKAGRKQDDDELKRLAARLANDFDLFDRSDVPLSERRDRGPVPRGHAIEQMKDTLYQILKNLKG